MTIIRHALSDDKGVEMTRYREVADHITDLINNSVYKVEEKLPSVRSVHQNYKVSISTALEAYRLLEDRGLIYAKLKSGYYVKGREESFTSMKAENISSKPESFGNTDMAMQILSYASSEKYETFGAACPGKDLISQSNLRKFITRQSRYSDDQRKYQPIPEGITQLRNEISKWSLSRGFFLNPSETIITNGCQEAVYLALKAITEPGDIILVESPCYYGNLLVAESLKLKIIEVPRDPKTGLNIENIEAIISQWPVKVGFFMPSNHNPLGTSIDIEQREAIVNLFSKYKISIIEDDIVGDLTYDGTYHPPLKKFDQDGTVIYCSSIAKTLGTSIRLGWVSSEKYFKGILSEKYILNQSTNYLSQAALADYLAEGHYRHYIKTLQSAYYDRKYSFYALIKEHFPKDIQVSCPKGGYWAWIRLPDAINSVDLYKKALENHITIVPGAIFSTKDIYKNYIRLSFASDWTDSRKNSLINLGKLIRKMT